MPKVKVLMVLATTNIGGAEMFVLNLLKKMDMTRFQVDVVANFKEQGKGISEELKALGCRIYYLPYFRVVNYFQYVKAWDDFLTEHHYDIVHGHASNSAGIYLRIAKKHGCKTIAHSHSAGFRGNIVQRAMKAVLASKVKYVADYWFACSGKAAEHLYGKSYKENEHYYTIPNAIDAEKYLYSKAIRKRIRKVLGVDEDTFLCGHVGSLTLPKNHEFLLNIFADLLTRKPNAKLLLCGDGPLKDSLKQECGQLGIRGNVLFQGVVRNVNEYMMAMDVLVFPSLFEGFPITIIEAEAAGLPVVMSDVITTEVDVTDCVKRMSLNDSTKNWADAICKTKANKREEYNTMVVNSVYNMRTTVNQIMNLYQELTII